MIRQIGITQGTKVYPIHMHTVLFVCGFIFSYKWINLIEWFTVYFTAVSLSLGQSYDCHYMMTSSNGSISALLDICAGNSPVTGEFRAQRPRRQSFDVFFDLRLNKRWSKRSWGWWSETPSRPLWRHCYESHDCPCASEATLKDTG